jgi:hypothetical protein
VLTIRNEQLDAFARASWQRFAQSQLVHVREYFTVEHEMLGGDTGTLDFIWQGIARVQDAGVTVMGDACRLIDLMLSLGLDFAADPQLPWAAAALNDESNDVSTRIDLLHDGALAYLDRVAGEDGQHYLRAVLRAGSLSYQEASADDGNFEASARALFLRLWPRKLREIRGGPMVRFLALATSSSERDGLGGPGARVVYAGLMFLLGSGFATDPLYPWAAGTLRDAALAGEARSRALIERAKEHLERTLAAIKRSRSG